VKKYISKGTLKAVKDFANKIGFKILQRTIIKYAVPLASAAVGSSYNYVTTKSVGRIAKAHFRNRGQVTDELRTLVSRQNTYDLAFPAAAMYMAQVDGEFLPKEREMYRAMLTRMSFDEHTQAEFRRLMATEEDILEAIAQIRDEEMRRSLVEVLVLMAIYDGELAQQEREFLMKAAERLDVPLDLDEVEQRTLDYQVIVRPSILEKTAEVAGEAVAKAASVAGQAAGRARGTATKAGDKTKRVIGKVLERGKGAKVLSTSEHPTTTCPSCGREIQAEFQFCPGCGQPTATERACPACGELLPIDFAFCPHCGASQDE